MENLGKNANSAFFTFMQNGRYFMPLTFLDEQESYDALPFFFWRFPTNQHLSKKFHTLAPGENNICFVFYSFDAWTLGNLQGHAPVTN